MASDATHVIIDDPENVRNVQTTGGNIGSHHDWHFVGSESGNRVLALFLSAVAVDGRDWEIVTIKPVVQGIGRAFCLLELMLSTTPFAEKRFQM
jgi:hypothetical protein